jgi:transposase-like protein
MINIQHLIDDAKCFEVIRQLRWPAGVRCPACGATLVNKRGFHTHQAHRQRYECQACGHAFDDLSDMTTQLREGIVVKKKPCNRQVRLKPTKCT